MKRRGTQKGGTPKGSLVISWIWSRWTQKGGVYEKGLKDFTFRPASSVIILEGELYGGGDGGTGDGGGGGLEDERRFNVGYFGYFNETSTKDVFAISNLQIDWPHATSTVIFPVSWEGPGERKMKPRPPPGNPFYHIHVKMASDHSIRPIT